MDCSDNNESYYLSDENNEENIPSSANEEGYFTNRNEEEGESDDLEEEFDNLTIENNKIKEKLNKAVQRWNHLLSDVENIDVNSEMLKDKTLSCID